MPTQYEPVMGLEIHVQAKTKTKMFSRVSAEYFEKEPNTCVDPVSLGLPGALPVPNKKAIEHCIKISLALGCKINETTKFDRKNYFYPDLPKGYQISQYDQPIGYEGQLDISNGKLTKTIKITRVHMEEDTGKSIHEGANTFLDFNKAGVPLIEIVTEPEFRNGEEIDAFAKRLRQIVRMLGISDADMEKGQMRYELNISLRKPGETQLPNYKVEVKNIGSISLLQKVLNYEIERQTEILEKDETPIQETRGTRDMTGATISQRVKENANDYRYFPEPDIPPINFTKEYIETLKKSLPKLPQQLWHEYKEIGLNDKIIEGLFADENKLSLFESFRTKFEKDNELLNEFAKLIMGEIAVLMTEEKLNLELIKEQLDILAELCKLKIGGKISSTNYKQVFSKVVENSIVKLNDLNKVLKDGDFLSSNDGIDLNAIIEKVIATDPEAKNKFAKNANIAMFFVGLVMKETKGKANPQEVKTMVEKKLQA